jgi:hypothetical protein
MWQIQWMLGLIPDSIFIWITYLLFSTGLVLYIASKLIKWFPVISRYKLLSEVVGVVLLVVSAYIYGAYGTEMAWREKVRELEAKVAESEAKSKTANSVIQEKIVTKVKEIKVFQDRIKEVIIEKEKIIDAQCRVPDEALDILNQAAKGSQK